MTAVLKVYRTFFLRGVIGVDPLPLPFFFSCLLLLCKMFSGVNVRLREVLFCRLVSMGLV
jgi:hypothetical protein